MPEPGTRGNSLTAVSMRSASDAWAVGGYDQPGLALPIKTLAMHWNGTAWSVTKTPSPGSEDQLSAVTAVSASDAWAVGGNSPSMTILTLILHWNGKTWTRSTAPAPPGN